MDSLETRYWKRVKRVLPILKCVPFLEYCAVCNNLAFGQVHPGSDIDLFIVARAGRLFIVRSMVTVLLHVLGVRRHDEKVRARFCLSFFVDTTALDMSAIALENDVYLAYWLTHMVPLIDRMNISDRLPAHNRWALMMHDEEIIPDRSRIFRNDPLTAAVRWGLQVVFSGFVGDGIERILRGWQLARARRKAESAGSNGLVITPHMLKFHNIDRRTIYRDRWYARFGKGEKLSKARFLSL